MSPHIPLPLQHFPGAGQGMAAHCVGSAPSPLGAAPPAPPALTLDELIQLLLTLDASMVDSKP